MELIDEYIVGKAIWQYCSPLLLALGTFGNLMCIIILQRLKINKSAMFVFLRALAVSDTSILYTGLLRQWLMNAFDLDFRTINDFTCKVRHFTLGYDICVLILAFYAFSLILIIPTCFYQKR